MATKAAVAAAARSEAGLDVDLTTVGFVLKLVRSRRKPMPPLQLMMYRNKLMHTRKSLKNGS